MSLFIWEGALGLPSIDSTCLTVLAYCKFSGVPLTTVPKRVTCGELPVFKQSGEEFCDVQEIFSHLRKQHRGTDFNLSAKQSADMIAYTALIEEKLVPGLDHTLWVDSANYSTVTRPQFANSLMFPIGIFIPNNIHKEKVQKIHAMRSEFTNEQDRETKVYNDAKECLNVLSTILGDNNFFFGDNPSSLDAIVFGYLSPLLKFPLPNPVLQNHAKACSNLCSFCNRILEKFFPLSKQEEEALRETEERRRKEEQERTEYPHKTRTMILAGIVAFSSMVAYAFASGILYFPKDSKIGSNSQKNKTLEL